MSDAALVISQMQLQQGFRKLADERVEMVNGQVLTVRTAEPRTFAGGMQRESAAGQGFTPRADKLDESIILKLSPLLTFEGDSVDASIDLTVNTVRMFHRTKVIAPREQGPPEMSIDVPEVSMTHLDQTVKNWPLGQTLLITGGIHPGILDKKGGWLGTPFGAPTSTEVLVFLDAETVSRGRSRASSRGRTGRPRPTPRRPRPAPMIPRMRNRRREPARPSVPPAGPISIPSPPATVATAAARTSKGSCLVASSSSSVKPRGQRRGDCTPTDLASQAETVYNGLFGPYARSLVRLLHDAVVRS